MYFMRVTQRSMYGQMLTNMNKSLSDLMNSNIQAASEKRINRPSDDPSGMARVLNYRASLDNIAQYQANVGTATGWLKTADSVLSTQVTTVLTRFSELCEQGATGSMTAENREEISYEMRQLFKQIVQYANQTYEGHHIFAGHKTAGTAFEEALNVTCNDKTFATADVDFSVEGAAEKTVVVQFRDSGPLTTGMAVQYSEDSGKTWKDGAVTVDGSGEFTTIALGGQNIIVHHPNGTPPTATAVDPTNLNETDNGTWLYVRPTAVYKGDDNDSIEVAKYGSGLATGVAQGYFPADVNVRLDTAGPPYTYSYSVDGGSTWVTGNQAAGDRLLVPGGFLDLDTSGGAAAAGDQFVIHPRRADISLEINSGEYIKINNIGKDVFGGIYKSPGDDWAKTVYGNDDARTLIEVLGRAVAYAETNSQDGCQRALEEINTARSVILTFAASVGGRENRLEAATDMLDNMELTETQTLSNVEDVDFSKLMTQLAQQQLAYQSVLKSSSMIMQMSLLNYI